MGFCLGYLYNYEANLASDFGMKSEIYSLTVQVKEKQILPLEGYVFPQLSTTLAGFQIKKTTCGAISALE
jgi:hypothetical protein